MRQARVFDGDRLRAVLFNPGKTQLFVSFRQRVDDPGRFADPRPVRSFLRKGYSHLHLQSRLNDWFINSETSALEAELEVLTARFERVVAMGFSMGGYGALRFARALRLDHLIAVSAQYSISPDHVPFDRRYRDCSAEFDADLGDLSGRGNRAQGVLLADPFRPVDLLNAQMIATVFPNLRVMRLAGGGHPATQIIREGGKFGALQRQLLNGPVDARRVSGLHRAARRSSAKYWDRLARATEARSGRVGGNPVRDRGQNA